MIVKPYQKPQQVRDPFQQAGDRAEATMAHYLKRTYGDEPEVHIFNNLRVLRGDEVAQMDHLVLHRTGIIIIESKSVSTAVRINEREEWAREREGRWQGMQSPIFQAELQSKLLHQLLQDHHKQLRRKALFGLLQGDFTDWPIEVLVAISDHGLLQAKGQRAQVCKADQVPRRIQELLEARRSRSSSPVLVPEEFERVSRFLLMQHQDRPVSSSFAPRPSTATPPASATPHSQPQARPSRPAPQQAGTVKPPAARASTPLCSKCRSTHLEIKFSPHHQRYRFKCLRCHTGMDIKLAPCPRCKSETRLSKQKGSPEFKRVCKNKACDYVVSFFTNPSESATPASTR